MYPSQPLRYSLLAMALLLAATAVLLAAAGVMLALQGMPESVLAAEQEPATLPTWQPLQPVLTSARALTPTPSALPARMRLPTPDSRLAPRRAAGAPRIGLQAGHWKIDELPDELAGLRTSTGAYVAGIEEFEVNLDIALQVAALLEREGVLVDVLPATVPPDYSADAFIALHCDGAFSASARGYKLATPWDTSPADQQLLEALSAEYGAATQLPLSYTITPDMRGYYAFDYFEHSIDGATPAVIVELGYLTNAGDRELLLGNPGLVAQGLASGILRYLGERPPARPALPASANRPGS